MREKPQNRANVSCVFRLLLFLQLPTRDAASFLFTASLLNLKAFHMHTLRLLLRVDTNINPDFFSAHFSAGRLRPSCLVVANQESSLYFPTISTFFRINSHSQGGCDSATVSFLGLIAPSVFLLGLFERWQSASPPLQWRPRKKPPLFTFCYRVQSKKCHRGAQHWTLQHFSAPNISQWTLSSIFYSVGMSHYCRIL